LARRLKQAVPEFEEVEDQEGDEQDEENVWVHYQNDTPDMKILGPMLKRAECMVDPRVAGSYHLKLGAAKRLAGLLGEGFVVENGKIVRGLPFAFEWKFKHPQKDAADQVYDQFRKFLDGASLAQKDYLANLKGLRVFNEGQKPDELKPGWLYISVPKQSTCANIQGTYNGTKLAPEAYAGQAPQAKRLANGLATDGDELDFAAFGPQCIYLRIYVSGAHLAHVLSAAIKSGCQKALAFIGGPVALNVWLLDGIADFQAQRGGLLKAEQARRDEIKQAIAKAAQEIVDKQLALESSEALVSLFARKLDEEGMIKQFPSLANVQSIDRDDPSQTVILTKDLLVNGVNLGAYRIKLNHEQMRVVVNGKYDVDGVIHPNIWREGEKWSFDMQAESLRSLVEALATRQYHRACSIVLDNLLAAPKDGDHAKRLDVLRLHIDKLNKPKERKPKAKPEEPAKEVANEAVAQA
jgi:hypothetical protein